MPRCRKRGSDTFLDCVFGLRAMEPFRGYEYTILSTHEGREWRKGPFQNQADQEAGKESQSIPSGVGGDDLEQDREFMLMLHPSETTTLALAEAHPSRRIMPSRETTPPLGDSERCALCRNDIGRDAFETSPCLFHPGKCNQTTWHSWYTCAYWRRRKTGVKDFPTCDGDSSGEDSDTTSDSWSSSVWLCCGQEGAVIGCVVETRHLRPQEIDVTPGISTIDYRWRLTWKRG